MNKFLRRVLLALGVLVGLLIAATLALQVFFPSAKLKELVKTQIRLHTGREAEVGNVHLGLRSLSVAPLNISNTPAFTAGTFLTVEHLRVRWALLPLLSRRLRIQEIFLEKPRIDFIRESRNGSGNQAPLAGTSGSTRSPARSGTDRPGANPLSWNVKEIHLHDATLQVTDHTPAKMNSMVSKIDLVLRDFNPSQAQGRLTFEQLQNPVYTARDFAAEWELDHIDPSLSHLSGWMRLKQGNGLIQNLHQLAASSRAAKLALMPIVALQTVDRLGFIRLGLPDLSRLDVTEIVGDYTFKEGTMHVNRFTITGRQLSVEARGTVELGSGALALDVTMNTPQPVLNGETTLKLHVSGTLANPKTDLGSLKKKMFKATVNQLLNKPEVKQKINDTLQQIFK